MTRRAFLLCAGLLTASWTWAGSIHSEGASQEPDSYDIVLEKGMILDGTGNPFFIADIGIRVRKASFRLYCPRD